MQTLSPLRKPLASASLALAALLAASGAQAITLVGLTSSNELARFDSASPASAVRVAITGLAAGDRFVGIDLRPSNNLIYGVSLSNNLYTVNATTGAATFVTALSSPVINGSLGYGIDFNPVADYSGAASLRLVSSAGDNFAINAATGAVGNAANTIAAGYAGVAYSNSVPLSTGPASTALYYINSTTDTLAVATTAFNTPTITTVGSLGVDVLRANGFEIAPDGTAYAALNLDNGSSLVTGIYTINLGTGAATLLGQYNGTLSGLTIAPVPEPGTYGMLLLGLGVVGFKLRRRQARA